MASKPSVIVEDDFFAAAEAQAATANAGLEAVSSALSSFAVTVKSDTVVPLGEHTWTLASGVSKTGEMGLSVGRISLMEFSVFRQNRSNGEGTMDVANFLFGLDEFQIGFLLVDGTLRPIPLQEAGTPMRLFYAQRMAVNTEVTDQLREYLSSLSWMPRQNSATPALGETYPESERVVKREMIWNLQPRGNQTQRHSRGAEVEEFTFTPTFNAERRPGGYRSIVEAVNLNMNDIIARTAHIEANGGTDEDKNLARRFTNAVTGAQRDDSGVIATRENADRFSVSSFTTLEPVRNRKGEVVATTPTEWLITSGTNEDGESGAPVAGVTPPAPTPVDVSKSGF